MTSIAEVHAATFWLRTYLVSRLAVRIGWVSAVPADVSALLNPGPADPSPLYMLVPTWPSAGTAWPIPVSHWPIPLTKYSRAGRLLYRFRVD